MDNKDMETAISAGITGGIKDASKELLSPTLSAVGQIVSFPFRTIRIMLAPYERWIHQKEAEREDFLNLISKRVADKLSGLSEEQIAEPEPYVIVPALQLASYCMTNEDLAEVIAKLIASSMTIGRKEYVHPAFVEIIRQLSPLDAKLMQFNSARKRHVPICSIWVQKRTNINNLQITRHSEPIITSHARYRPSETGGVLLLRYVCIAPFSENGTIEQFSASLENLIRLGIYQSDSGVLTSEVENYKLLGQIADTIDIEACANSVNISTAALEEMYNSNYEAAYIPSMCSLTVFGGLFLDACFGNKRNGG